MTEETVDQQDQDQDQEEGQEGQPEADRPDNAAASQLAIIVQQRKRVYEAEIQVYSLREQLKSAKGKLEALTSELLAKIDAPLLPFGGATANTQSAPVADDSWKAVTLDELGITGRGSKGLTEAGITTLGQIAAWTEHSKLTDIGGIGDGTAEKIEDACQRYWLEHPRGTVETFADDGDDSDLDGDSDTDLDDEVAA